MTATRSELEITLKTLLRDGRTIADFLSAAEGDPVAASRSLADWLAQELTPEES